MQSLNLSKHFFLFNGCFWHRHHCKTSRESIHVQNNPERQNKFEKIEGLCSKYGNLHLIFGCEWDQLRKNIAIQKPFSVFFERKHVKESELVTAILNDQLFGLVKCNIHSPDHVIDRYMRVNYPPITSRVSPEEDMIGEHIRNRLKRSRKKIANNQLTQV